MVAGTPSTDQIPTGAGLRAELTRGLLPWWLLRTNGYQFHYGADTAWVFGFEVKPEFRISGIFHKHWLVALELLAPLGISRVVGTIQADNPHSLQSHRRLGFRPLCRYRMTRVCGVLQYQVTPEDGSSVSARSGLQAWPVSIRG
jgi:hypothetical protein